ncbi:hypothetical protein SBG_0858 [Salmonella bongori NCTC 12419]|uniref:Uncharacterized protein n=1 Tax=Salmonella bongori (strain ATCC 43975 / DSM 13772 / NCTC 12419) TaxID=218493 RepID=A0A0K0H943_SALBC|nr:hypothetical protein SBG_0858 [Salmonella bongori NCTC 12419]
MADALTDSTTMGSGQYVWDADPPVFIKDDVDIYLILNSVRTDNCPSSKNAWCHLSAGMRGNLSLRSPLSVI